MIKINFAKESQIKFENKTLTINIKEFKDIILKSQTQNCISYIDFQHDNGFKIYNIKVLSMLGKFYYIQTKNGDKFEIDSDLIISKERD